MPWERGGEAGRLLHEGEGCTCARHDIVHALPQSRTAGRGAGCQQALCSAVPQLQSCPLHAWPLLRAPATRGPLTPHTGVSACSRRAVDPTLWKESVPLLSRCTVSTSGLPWGDEEGGRHQGRSATCLLAAQRPQLEVEAAAQRGSRQAVVLLANHRPSNATNPARAAVTLACSSRASVVRRCPSVMSAVLGGITCGGQARPGGCRSDRELGSARQAGGRGHADCCVVVCHPSPACLPASFLPLPPSKLPGEHTCTPRPACGRLPAPTERACSAAAPAGGQAGRVNFSRGHAPTHVSAAARWPWQPRGAIISAPPAPRQAGCKHCPPHFGGGGGHAGQEGVEGGVSGDQVGGVARRRHHILHARQRWDRGASGACGLAGTPMCQCALGKE